MTDEDFRAYACKSFARACIAEGFHFSKEEVFIMENLDFQSFAALSGMLDKGIRRGNAIYFQGGTDEYNTV